MAGFRNLVFTCVLDDHHTQTAPHRRIPPRGIRAVIVIIEAVCLTTHLCIKPGYNARTWLTLKQLCSIRQELCQEASSFRGLNAGGRTRTDMSVTSPDFESGAYTNFATPAQ
jgi:hypothetical protein